MKIAVEREIRGGATRIAFAPDSSRYLAADDTGKLVVCSLDGVVLATGQVPPVGEYIKRAHVSTIAWSPAGDFLGTIENSVTVRLRRADDLSIVSELEGFGALDDLAFGGGGSFLAIANRKLRLRSVPSLAEISTRPIARKDVDTFDVYAITCDPDGTLIATCDMGGYSEDENDVKTVVDGPQVSLFDTDSDYVRLLDDRNGRVQNVVFDRWRKCLYTVCYNNGTSTWSLDGKLLGRWRPYESRRNGTYVPFASVLAVTERFLVTMPDRHARVKTTIDLWEPTSRELLASIEIPPNEEPGVASVTPDGSLLVTPMRNAASGRTEGMRFWRVTG